ncbi:DUF4269 domain-containing protein [Paenibacillus sp.]|jgi:hypothetical protein|uniref:DUF4269 domain-containing protein n=1 Tax=Paenibacillus sp. TaxID=58172 RepID=UPI00283807A2|nr:DUF4269 domain-containing protein [Paenibacillus sp.]MDR0266539.1 DUF4269 domain-containing protein [Paenibacillus sp.]
MIVIGTRSSHVFIDLSYLKSENTKQMEAYAALVNLGIFEKLAKFGPVLAGTIPIDIDIGGSDLDIICEMREPEAFAQILTAEFGFLEGFRITRSLTDAGIALVCNFEFGSWPVEIFAQGRPVVEQNAYKHMVIEHRILEKLGLDFREQVRLMKRDGLKTEPAFARLLRLDGDPYQTMLEMYDWNDQRLHRFLERKYTSKWR